MLTGVKSLNNNFGYFTAGLVMNVSENPSIGILSMILAPNNFVWPSAIRKGWRIFREGEWEKREFKRQGLHFE